MNTTESPKTDSSNGFRSSPDPHHESDPLFTGHRFTAKSSERESPGLLRRMARRWWQIGILWLLISVPLINLIHALVKPTYVATSLLEVDPAQADIFAPLKRDGVESHDLNYLRTQVDVITSNPVLESALANPFVVNLPTIKRFEDPRYELREKLKVEIIADTNLIRIALELPNKDEAVAIVKAVTNSYVVQNVTYSRRAGRAHTETYETQLMKIEKDIDSKRNMLKDFVKKRKAAGITPSQMLNPKTETDPIQPTLSKVTEEQFAALIDRQMQCDLEYLDALSELDAVKAVRERDKDRINEDLATRIEDEFKKGPHVVDLLDKIRESEDLAKSKDQDPPLAVLAAQEKLGKLSKRL
jgi:capsular polysaccharide biosynthesis protein